jgi:hypothetical protein
VVGKLTRMTMLRVAANIGLLRKLRAEQSRGNNDPGKRDHADVLLQILTSGQLYEEIDWSDPDFIDIIDNLVTGTVMTAGNKTSLLNKATMTPTRAKYLFGVTSVSEADVAKARSI